MHGVRGGRSFTGSARALTRILDEDVLRLALADAGPAPILATTVLRHGETRLALIGTDETTRTRLTIALIAAGMAFEGDGFAVMGPDGPPAASQKAAPHARRDRTRHGSPVGLPDGTVDLPIARDATCSMVDPTFGGQPWRVVRGAIQHFVFLDGNDQGRAGLAPIALAEALARTMRRIHVPVTSVAGLALIHKMLAGARFSRLTLGPISEGAATLMRTLAPADRPPRSAHASQR